MDVYLYEVVMAFESASNVSDAHRDTRHIGTTSVDVSNSKTLTGIATKFGVVKGI